MEAAEIDQTRRDLANWSQPVIFDVVTEGYVALVGAGHYSFRVLVAMHARAWRLMLLDDRAKLLETRKELADLARLAGLSRQSLERIDNLVLEELLDVVNARFGRSAEVVRAYSRLLLRTATSLAEMRLAEV